MPFKYRRLIREVQDFLPEASRTSRALSMHCFETRTGNCICPYHSEKDKTGTIFDGAPDCKYNVTGVPHPRNVRGPKDDDVPERPEGYLHCGCPEDEVLMDFIWWKGASVTSPVTGETEGFRDQRLDPRTRAFMYDIWCEATCQEVDDIYRQGRVRETFTVDLFRARIAAIEKEIGTIEKDKKDTKTRKEKST